MLKPILIAAILVPHMAVAADLDRHKHRHGSHRVARQVVEQNNVIHCTTTKFLGFLTYSDCGQGFDPFATATN